MQRDVDGRARGGQSAGSARRLRGRARAGPARRGRRSQARCLRRERRAAASIVSPVTCSPGDAAPRPTRPASVSIRTMTLLDLVDRLLSRDRVGPRQRKLLEARGRRGRILTPGSPRARNSRTTGTSASTPSSRGRTTGMPSSAREPVAGRARELVRRQMLAVERHGERPRAVALDQRDLVGERRDLEAELLEPLVERPRRRVLEDHALRAAGEQELGAARARTGCASADCPSSRISSGCRSFSPAGDDRVLELARDEVVRHRSRG